MPTPDIYGMLGAFIASTPDADSTPAPPALQMAPTESQTAPAASDDALTTLAGVGTPQDAAVNAAQNLLQGKAAAERSRQAALKTLGDAQKQSESAADAEASLRGDEAAVQAPIFAEHAQLIKQHEASMMETLPKYQAEATKQFDEYIRASDDFAKTRVYNWWGEAGTGAKSLGIISQFMAGALQGLTGNIGASTPMDRVIENDLQLQKANLAKKGETVSMKRGLYADLIDRFKSEKLADEAFRSAAWNSTLQRADAMVRSMPELQRRQAEVGAQKLKADASLRLASSKSAIQEHLSEQATQEAFKASDLGVSLAHLGLQQSEAARAAAGGSPDKLLAGIPSIPGSEHLPEKEQAQVRTAKVATNEIQEISNQIARIASNTKISINERHRQVDALKGKFVLQVKNQEQLGVLSEGDLTLVAQIAGRTFDDNVYRMFNFTSEADRKKAAVAMGVSAQERYKRLLSTYVNPTSRTPLVDQEAQ